MVTGKTYRKVISTETKEIVPDNCRTLLKNLLIGSYAEKITFSPYAWAKINCYINLIGDLEITGLGKIEDNIVTDVALLKQEVESAEVNCDQTAISNFLMSLPEEEKISGCWKLDWHSHVNMTATPSGTDDRNYEQMLKIRMGKPFPVVIINKQQEIYGAMYLGNKNYRDLKVFYQGEKISDKDFSELYIQCKKDVLENCVENVYHYQTYGGYGGYYKNGIYYKDGVTKLENNVLTTKNFHGSIEEDTIPWDEVEVEDCMKCKACGSDLYYTDEIEAGMCDVCLEELRASYVHG
jgi:hypothetical protein